MGLGPHLEERLHGLHVLWRLRGHQDATGQLVQAADGGGGGVLQRAGARGRRGHCGQPQEAQGE